MPDDLPVPNDGAAPGKKSATKSTAKKAPAKKAATKKAPAKKAATKKAPAKKAPAKKAPAKKAAQAQPTEARTAIFDRIHELEERIAADAPLPPRQRPKPPPAKKPPTKRPAPAARSITFDPSAPPEPAVSPPPVVAVDPVALDPAIAPVVPVPLVPEASLVDPLPTAPVESTVVVPVQRAEAPAVPKALVALIVLLLMAAAGMVAAAAVKDRPSTWRSEAVVSITPSTAAAEEDTADKTKEYAETVESEGFAGLTVALVGLSDENLRELFEARTADSEVTIEVRADTADHAAILAEAASRQLVTTVRDDQQSIVDPTERLDAVIEQATERAVREEPTDRQAWLAGGLAALAMLLLGGIVVLLASTSRSRERT